MKRKMICCFMALALCLSFAAHAFASAGDFTVVDGVLTNYNGAGGDVVIPDGVTGIGDFAFSDNAGLISIKIPAGVTDIGNDAFVNCTNLISAAIPDSVASIGVRAFFVFEQIVHDAQNVDSVIYPLPGLTIYGVAGSYAEAYAKEHDIPFSTEALDAAPPAPQPPPVEPAADGIKVILDGKALAFDVPPQNVNGRILVPLRAIFEEMGASIDYDPATQTVTATKGDTVVVLAIGDLSPTVNGEIVPIDQPGIIVDGRTLAPLRFVAEAFGGSVEWEGATQTATITT